MRPSFHNILATPQAEAMALFTNLPLKEKAKAFQWLLQLCRDQLKWRQKIAELEAKLLKFNDTSCTKKPPTLLVEKPCDSHKPVASTIVQKIHSFLGGDRSAKRPESPKIRPMRSSTLDSSFRGDVSKKGLLNRLLRKGRKQGCQTQILDEDSRIQQSYLALIRQKESISENYELLAKEHGALEEEFKELQKQHKSLKIKIKIMEKEKEKYHQCRQSETKQNKQNKNSLKNQNDGEEENLRKGSLEYEKNKFQKDLYSLDQHLRGRISLD